MKNLPYGKVKKCCASHPVVTAVIVMLIVAAVAFAIAAIVKMAQREEDLLDEEWDLDAEDEDEVYFYPGEEEFIEGE